MENNLIEELFCLKYELDALAEITLRNESERWIPGFIHQKTERDHIQRYELACKYVEYKDVIDIACGIGRGSYFLAQKGNARNVFGYDLSENAIRYAKHRNKHPHIKFEIKNAEQHVDIERYDVAVSFETIEHLKNYELFLRNIHTSLKTGGLLIISTPISNKEVDTKPKNPYHVQEWGFMSFQKIIEKYFKIDEIFVQLYPYFNIKEPKDFYLLRRIFKRIKRTFGIANNDLQNQLGANESVSRMEKFINQYPYSELGVNRIGYQIIIAKKYE